MLPPGSVAPLQRLVGRCLHVNLSSLHQPQRWLTIKSTTRKQQQNASATFFGSGNSRVIVRTYTSGKDKKILNNNNNNTIKQSKTLTETKSFTNKECDSSDKKSKDEQQNQQNTDSKVEPGSKNPTAAKPVTKTLEIRTPKGLLSVTTTIEDSKINDIILEKSKSVRPKPTKKKTDETKIAQQQAVLEETAKTTETTANITNATIAAETTETLIITNSNTAPTTTISTQPTEESLKEKNKAKKAAKLQEAKSDVMGAAAAAADVAKTTVASAAAAVKELLTKKDVSAAASAAAAADNGMVKPKPRIKVDLNRSSLERNFITPTRAMSDFLLTPGDLENLPKIKRRSPYEREPPMTVYWRKDVEARAIEVWGSREKLLKEALKRELERKQHQQNIFTVKRRLRDYRREIGYRTTVYENEPGLRGKSGQVVLIAVGINSINFLFKVCAWLYTGSHSMFAEAIHSLADTINQLILAYGIHKSTQMADSDHPYGYSNMRYVSSLISGVGIFCVGTGLSFYHGITGLMHPEPISDFFWAFFILGGSLVSEGATLLVAINEIKRSAKLQEVSFKDYVISGKDPCVNVVLTEDAAAVASVFVATACMGLSQVTGSPVFDAMGSLFVGGILGAVASFIIYTNVQALVGKSIPEERLNKINAELESDVMIRAIHDVKGIDMGNFLVRYKAEMDFDGRELTRSYLDKQDLNELLKVVKSFQTVEELEQFLLTHGENIVDLMGGEIDRIEMKLRKKFPEIRHCDLEIL